VGGPPHWPRWSALVLHRADACVTGPAIEVKHRHITPESVVLEVMIRGTHLGPWRGLAATGRRMEFPLCGIYSFDAEGKLASERIYYDRGTILRQLGLFHKPVQGLGCMVTVLGHPITIARAYLRRVSRKIIEP